MSKCYASAVIATAAAEIGYKEKASNSQLDSKTANAGSANYTKYARDFDTLYPKWYNGKKNGFSWCDMFVDWCFIKTFGYTEALRLLCQPEKSAGAGCAYSLGYYKAKGQFYTSNPKPGDQIFFGPSIATANHTGIVEKVDNTKVYTIEGNTSNQVARRSYSLNAANILGYGRPAYDVEPDSAQQSTGATAAKSGTALTFKVGDQVKFSGSTHYTNANAASGSKAKACTAKVTAISGTGKHPYHLIGDGVYGWVNAADVQALSSAKSIEAIAKEVIAGKWGNGDERKKRLTAAGYDYAAVQKKVNELTKK